MTLTQLRYLLAIVDANLNITLAAERVHATQPGVSKQLKLLEDELGLQIFIRRGKSLARVSQAGDRIIERARVIVSEAANIRNLAANERGESDGQLILATTQTQARFVLPPALKRLKAQYPDVSVRLNLFTDAAASRAASQDADLTIASAAVWPETFDVVIPLYRWRRVAIAPADHPLARITGRPLFLADLAAHPLIGYESALGSHASVAQAFAEAGHPAQFAYAAHDAEVIKTYVRTGLGVGLIAEMIDTEADLTRLSIKGLPDCTTYALLSRDRVVRDYVIEFLASLAPHIPRRDLTRSLHPSGSVGRVVAPTWGEWVGAVGAVGLPDGRATHDEAVAAVARP